MIKKFHSTIYFCYFFLLTICINAHANNIPVIIENAFENYVSTSLGLQEYSDNNLYQWVYFSSNNNQSTADFGCFSKENKYQSTSIFTENRTENINITAVFVLNNKKLTKKKFLLGHDLPMNKKFSIKLKINCLPPS